MFKVVVCVVVPVLSTAHFQYRLIFIKSPAHQRKPFMASIRVEKAEMLMNAALTSFLLVTHGENECAQHS